MAATCSGPSRAEEAPRTEAGPLNVDAIRTFLELSRLGNFSRVAEHMHLTQSTVSARIKVLEDHLNCRLFERTPSGVSLTNAGKRFHRYAASMQQLWQQGRQEVRLPSGFEGSVGVGVHMTMWRRFMPGWLLWMREHQPHLALHVEADYSERLTDYVLQGILDLAITHMPQVVSGLVVEPFTVDRLVMVSREPMSFEDCKNDEYIYVDWSYGYREEHMEKLPGLQTSPFNIGYGEIALEYLLVSKGFTYLPETIAQGYVEAGRLQRVTDAPSLKRPSFLVYPEVPTNPKHITAAVEGLRAQL